MKDILIVEDGRVERDRLVELFAGAGFTVTGCDSAASAEQAVSGSEYRLAILDIGLGDRSGSFLFGAIKRGGRVRHLLICTGNPSVHLKQRFLDEGAVDYIVKGSPQAQSESFRRRVFEILGEPGGVLQVTAPLRGFDLEDFLAHQVTAPSRELFLDQDGRLPACKKCQGRSYRVSFESRPQVPPTIVGEVTCSACGCTMDPEVG